MLNKIIPLLIFLLTSSLACQNEQFSSEGEFKFSLPFGRNYDYNNILIKRVIDGDTFQLENGVRVRLIGIDTPEVYFSEKIYQQAKRLHKDIKTVKTLGRKATQFSKKLVEGKKVRLEFDVEKYDKYGRLLAYIYLKDGIFVNEEIIRQGYALVLTIPPNLKYKDVFLKAQKEARQNNRGLWKK